LRKKTTLVRSTCNKKGNKNTTNYLLPFDGDKEFFEINFFDLRHKVMLNKTQLLILEVVAVVFVVTGVP